MAHYLWDTLNPDQTWKNASQEEVVAALFDAPKFIDPADMGRIKQYHRPAIALYQQLFYQGDIPDSVRKLRQKRIGM